MKKQKLYIHIVSHEVSGDYAINNILFYEGSELNGGSHGNSTRVDGAEPNGWREQVAHLAHIRCTGKLLSDHALNTGTPTRWTNRMGHILGMEHETDE